MSDEINDARLRLRRLRLGQAGARSTIEAEGLTADRTHALPDASGTLALVGQGEGIANLLAPGIYDEDADVTFGSPGDPVLVQPGVLFRPPAGRTYTVHLAEDPGNLPFIAADTVAAVDDPDDGTLPTGDTLETEAFTGADDDPLPAGWVTVWQDGDPPTIQGNRAALPGDNFDGTSVRWNRGPYVHQEVSVEIDLPALEPGKADYHSVSVRGKFLPGGLQDAWGAETDGYVFSVYREHGETTGDLQIWRSVEGVGWDDPASLKVVAQVDMSAAGTARLVLRAVGGELRGKVYYTNASDPGWQIHLTDPDTMFQSGHVWLGYTSGGPAIGTFDNVEVKDVPYHDGLMEQEDITYGDVVMPGAVLNPVWWGAPYVTTGTPTVSATMAYRKLMASAAIGWNNIYIPPLRYLVGHVRLPRLVPTRTIDITSYGAFFYAPARFYGDMFARYSVSVSDASQMVSSAVRWRGGRFEQPSRERGSRALYPGPTYRALFEDIRFSGFGRAQLDAVFGLQLEVNRCNFTLAGLDGCIVRAGFGMRYRPSGPDGPPYDTAPDWPGAAHDNTASNVAKIQHSRASCREGQESGFKILASGNVSLVDVIGEGNRPVYTVYADHMGAPAVKNLTASNVHSEHVGAAAGATGAAFYVRQGGGSVVIERLHATGEWSAPLVAADIGPGILSLRDVGWLTSSMSLQTASTSTRWCLEGGYGTDVFADVSRWVGGVRPNWLTIQPEGVVIRPSNNLGGASATLTRAHIGRLQRVTHNGGSVTLTIPADNTENMPVGSEIVVQQAGTSKATFVGGAGVTIHSEGGKTRTIGQHAVATLRKTGGNQWLLYGSLETT